MHTFDAHSVAWHRRSTPAKAAARSIDHGRFGYARVSTRGQTLEVQLAALGAAAVAPANVFAEKKSGRPAAPGRSGRTCGPACAPATPWW